MGKIIKRSKNDKPYGIFKDTEGSAANKATKKEKEYLLFTAIEFYRASQSCDCN